MDSQTRIDLALDQAERHINILGGPMTVAEQRTFAKELCRRLLVLTPPATPMPDGYTALMTGALQPDDLILLNGHWRECRDVEICHFNNVESFTPDTRFARKLADSPAQAGSEQS